MPEVLKPIRFLLSDIDGTLLLADHSLSRVTVDAVTRLQTANIHFSVASARPPRAMRHYIEALRIDLPTAGFNGGNIVAADGRVLHAYRIEEAAARLCIELLAEHDVSLWLFADDQWFLTDRNGAYVDKEQHGLGYAPLCVESFEPYLGRVDKIVAASHDFELLKRLENQLNPLIEGQARASRSQLYYLDITALDANKGQALVTMAEHLGIDLAYTAAIGDGGNDVAMFERAGVSIAMGQAEQGVRERADHVTGSNLQDGVASAIERYVLPNR